MTSFGGETAIIISSNEVWIFNERSSHYYATVPSCLRLSPTNFHLFFSLARNQEIEKAGTSNISRGPSVCILHSSGSKLWKHGGPPKTNVNIFCDPPFIIEHLFCLLQTFNWVQSNSVITNFTGPRKSVHYNREKGITVKVYVVKLSFGLEKMIHNCSL